MSSRNIGAIDLPRFIEDLREKSISQRCNITDPETAVDNFNATIEDVLNCHAPLETRVVRIRPNKKWYNEEIASEKQVRRRLERQWRISKLEIHRQLYTAQRGKVKSLIRAAKQTYFSGLVEDCHGDSGRLFRLTNELLNRKDDCSLPDHDSSLKLAKDFGLFYRNKVETICSNLSEAPVGVRRPIPAGIVTDALDSLRPVSVDEVMSIILKSPTKSCNLDPIPTRLLKQCLPVVVPAITSIINTTFESGTVPSSLKLANIRPILKKPGLDKNAMQNYRPISNLPFLSKVMERAAFSRLTDHLLDNEILDSHQSAYRAHHSVETVLVSLTDHLLKQMDEGNLTALVLLDVSSAFDTVLHSLMIDRLKEFGVTSTALRWFISYLSDRFQRVCIDGVKSDATPLTYGVPQGSVGGPLLFSIYTQPLGELIKRHNVGHHSYADDIQLFISFPPCGHNLMSAIKRLEECVVDISGWMTQNNLKLNGGKTEFMILGSKVMLNKIPGSFITVCDDQISPTTKCRNLGVVIDSNLTLNHHVSHTCKAIRFQLRNLSHIRRFLTRKATETMVHSLISSRLDFCNSLLIHLPDYQLQRLQQLQNSAARLVTLTKGTTHISPIIQALHWLPVRQRIIFKVILLVYQALHCTAPSYIQDLVRLYEPPRRLRSAHTQLLCIPRSRHSWGRRSFSSSGPELWNSLPPHLRNENSYSQFKSLLKTFLFSTY